MDCAGRQAGRNLRVLRNGQFHLNEHEVVFAISRKETHRNLFHFPEFSRLLERCEFPTDQLAVRAPLVQ